MRIAHQLAFRPERRAGRGDTTCRVTWVGIDDADAHFDRAEPSLLDITEELLADLVRPGPAARGIDRHRRRGATAEQAPDRNPQRLAENVPQRTISPAATKRWASVAVQADRRSRHTCEPPVVTRPSISIRSLSAIGIPCSGPMACSDRIALSAASAASRASSPYTSAEACSFPSAALIRASRASTRSTGESRRAPISADKT